MTTYIKPIVNVPRVKTGTVWVWTSDVSTRSGMPILKGMLATVLSETNEAPHGEIMERGYNLVVDVSGHVSIWATFEQCLSRGLLKPFKLDTGPRPVCPTSWERILSPSV